MAIEQRAQYTLVPFLVQKAGGPLAKPCCRGAAGLGEPRKAAWQPARGQHGGSPLLIRAAAAATEYKPVLKQYELPSHKLVVLLLKKEELLNKNIPGFGPKIFILNVLYFNSRFKPKQKQKYPLVLAESRHFSITKQKNHLTSKTNFPMS